MSLRKQAVSGLAWTFTEKFSVQGINFAVSVILARVLAPAEFGIIGMLSILMAVGNVLIDNGMTMSLVRTQQPTDDDYTVVFYFNLAASFLIYALVFLGAPFIAEFYDQPALTAISRVYCISFIIRALTGVHTARLAKALRFKEQMLIAIPSVFIAGCFGIWLATAGYGVWSLVYMNLIQVSLSSLLYWFRSRWIPSARFSTANLSSHLGFGYKLTISGILNALFENLNNLIVGKFFSAAQLGFFTRAASLKQFPVDNLAAALQRVTFPVFSSIQNDGPRLKLSYKKLMQQVLFWIAPLLTGMGVLAKPLFLLLFTEKWLPAVPYFQILCVTGIMHPLHLYNLNILNVKGRSDLFLRLEIVKKVYTIIGLLAVIPFGIYGLLWFQAVSTFLMFFVNTYYSGKLLDYPVKEQILDLLPIFANTILMGIVVWLIQFLIISYSPVADIILLTIGTLVGAVVYLGLSHITNSEALRDFRLIAIKK